VFQAHFVVKPTRLTKWMWALVVWNGLLLWIALGGPRGGYNSDAAGNGMASAFQSAFVELGAIVVGLLALLFVAVRVRGIRIALLCALALVSLFVAALLYARVGHVRRVRACDGDRSGCGTDHGHSDRRRCGACVPDLFTGTGRGGASTDLQRGRCTDLSCGSQPETAGGGAPRPGRATEMNE
jgi:hypothetical protein